MQRILIGLALIVALAGISGCKRGVAQQAKAEAVAESTPKAEDKKVANYCGAPTKAGLVYWMHKK